MDSALKLRSCNSSLRNSNRTPPNLRILTSSMVHTHRQTTRHRSSILVRKLHHCCWMHLCTLSPKQETKSKDGYGGKLKFRIRQFLCLSYLLLLLFSGVLNQPFTAIVVAGFYEAGLVGLFLVYVSPKIEKRDMRIGYLALGITLIVFCILWLEVFGHTRLLGNPMGD